MLGNTEINNLRITKLRTYLMSVISELIEQYGEMNINFLSKEPNNYSLDKIPVNPTQEQWIIGNFLNRDVYSFRSRVNYSADTMTNIENVGFFETFEKAWHFGGKGSSINRGYENANDISVRIPMEFVTDTELFTIGDIISIGTTPPITKQSDLDEFYNVTSITINEYGNNPHVHLGGK